MVLTSGNFKCGKVSQHSTTVAKVIKLTTTQFTITNYKQSKRKSFLGTCCSRING